MEGEALPARKGLRRWTVAKAIVEKQPHVASRIAKAARRLRWMLPAVVWPVWGGARTPSTQGPLDLKAHRRHRRRRSHPPNASAERIRRTAHFCETREGRDAPRDAPARRRRAMGRIEHALLVGELSARPNRPKTFARDPTVPQKVTNVSIYSIYSEGRKPRRARRVPSLLRRRGPARAYGGGSKAPAGPRETDSSTAALKRC